MTVNEIIALFRTETADIEAPFLWTEAEVVTYLNDAYVMLARFLGGVPDSTSAICTVEYVANEKAITLDKSIIRIVRAFRVSDGVEMNVIENTDTPLVRDASGNLTLLRVGSSTGLPEFIVMGADPLTAGIHPVPVANGSINMHVRRIPTTALVVGTAQPDDVRAEHHIHLIKWMKSMAYRKQDAETIDMDKAQLNEALFLQYCSQAVHEQERMRRKSRTSLRSGKDLKNPLLAGGSYRSYAGAMDAPLQQGQRQQGNQ